MPGRLGRDLATRSCLVGAGWAAKAHIPSVSRCSNPHVDVLGASHYDQVGGYERICSVGPMYWDPTEETDIPKSSGNKAEMRHFSFSLGGSNLKI